MHLAPGRNARCVRAQMVAGTRNRGRAHGFDRSRRAGRRHRGRGTTSGEVVSREPWLRRGSTFISLARRELDPAGWAKMDKVVVDSWEFNMLQREFKRAVESGLFSREQLHAEIHELVSGAKRGRERDDERILIHTCGLVSQDVALAHFLYRNALGKGLGLWLPRAR